MSSITVIRTYVNTNDRIVEVSHFGTYETAREAIEDIDDNFMNILFAWLEYAEDDERQAVLKYDIEIDTDGRGRVTLTDRTWDDEYTWLILDSDDNDEYTVL